MNPLVADANLCPKRLLPLRDGSGNVIGGIMVVQADGQNSIVVVTNQPQVLYPELSPAESQSFGALVISSGANGLHFRVIPPAVVNLFLQTDGAGNLQFGPPPVASIPNPLNAQVANFAGLATFNGAATFEGAVNLPGIAAGTIATFLGLNSSGGLVSGSPVTGSRSWYYESATRTSAAFPNVSVINGGFLTIGNRLYDPNGIVSIQSTSSLELIAGGGYEITWKGAFGQPLSNGIQLPGISLLVNGTIVNPGQRGVNSQTASGVVQATTIISGSHIYNANAGDIIQLQVVDPTVSGTSIGTQTPGLNCRDVEIFITKFS